MSTWTSRVDPWPLQYSVVPVQSVLCAVETGGDLAERVVRHAAGIAGVGKAPLTLLTVVEGRPSVGDEEALERLYNTAVPYGATYLSEVRFQVAAGKPVEVILAASETAGLVVLGTHGRAGLSRLLLGSTSMTVLERTPGPVLLVPPTDVDVVTLDFTAVALNFGTVLAAVDLREDSPQQLATAAEMATLSNRPWLCLTVANSDLNDHDAAAALRAITKGIEPRPQAFIVRRGDVAEEIARGAMQEHAGLVVMGLWATGRRRPGRIATSVARTGRALVLAVPE